MGRASPVFGTHKLSETPALQIYFRHPSCWTSFGAHESCRLILPVHNEPGVSGRHLRKDKFDEVLLKEWLQICDEHHLACKNGYEGHVPGMHIIDCSTKLVIPFSKETIDYVTLSYVWGSPCQEIADFELGHLARLPKVIEDAILLVRRLGFRYLWIDRYCIPQDEKTKLIQIQNMGKIYADSTLTIIAAAGVDPEYGIPGVSSTPRSENLSIRAGRYCMVGIRRPETEIRKSKWNTRGWTYQEALLSKRRLVFTSTQVYFQCQGMHCTESISVDVRALHSQKRVFYEKVDFGKTFPSPRNLRHQRTISDRIKEFLARDLSFDGDALNAMAGILRMYRDLGEPINFLCGLPIFSKASSILEDAKSITDNLTEALLWDGDNNMVRRLEFPSWSWAGWKYVERRTEYGRDVYHYDVFKYLDGYTDQKYPETVIKAEFGNGMSLEWESHHQVILEMSHANNYPRYLKVSGWTFQAQIAWKESWQFISPQTLAARSTGGLNSGLSMNEATIHEALGLIFTCTRSGWFRFLLLRLSEDRSSFERISYEVQKGDGVLIVHQEGEKAEFGALQLTWKEIRLG